MSCPTCDRQLNARPRVTRTVRTLVGEVAIERPYFYCRYCRQGIYPLDAALGLSQGKIQPDVQQAAADLATDLPYDNAAGLLERLSGISVSSERIYTLTNQVAEGLSVLDVAPSREVIDERVAEVAQDRFRRPVLVLGMDGAYVPSRPKHARGRRPGQARYRARRARWRHAWYEAKGFRFYLLDDDRIVHLMSWHQVQREEEVGQALQKMKDAGLIPPDTVRLCVIGDGAEWIWRARRRRCFPTPRRCSTITIAPSISTRWRMPTMAIRVARARMGRSHLDPGCDQGQVRDVLGGLRRMQPTTAEAAKAIDNCWVHLHEHRNRTSYGKLRRGGYPLGSGGIESSNKFISHVRLKRSGAWWYEESSNQMLALRCAKYNGTFDQVFRRYRQKNMEA